MTTYEVTAWCSVPYYTTFDLDAGSIGEALDKARRRVRDEYGEPCGGGESDWDEFEITSEGDSSEYVKHLEPSRLAEIAATELLDALRHGTDTAQRVLDSWERGDLAGSIRALSQWLSAALAAINQATKG